MKKKKKMTLIIIGTVLLALIAIGTSYAYWRLSIRQESTNRYTSTCFNVSIDLDKDEPITLNNAKPLSNEEGLALEPYTFTIENTCNAPANYSIQLNVLEESTLDPKYVKYTTTAADIKTVGLQNEVEAKVNKAIAYELKTGILLKGQKQEFSLRLWLDQYAPQSEVQRKTFNSKIVVDTHAKQETIIHADASGAEQPELNNGLIPVTYNSETGNWQKADTTKEWYNYDNQIWANAVTVTSSSRNTYTSATANTPISMNDIETMWVWVPRYEYQYTNLGNQYAGGSSKYPGEISINFISKDITAPSSDNFTIHDAFWWDNNNNGTKDTNEQLSGIWVAKFKMSDGNTNCRPGYSGEEGCDKITIMPHVKPNTRAWLRGKIGTYWTAIHNNMNGDSNIYGLVNSDVHLMKNMEWGAVAYLSQSKYGKYGNPNYDSKSKSVGFNNCSSNITGIGDGMNIERSADTCITNTYNTEQGQTASTTGNIYGIYDMSGIVSEFVMGVMKVTGSDEPAVGNGTSSNSGWSGKIFDKGWKDYVSDLGYGELKSIGSKYYDLYDYESDFYGNAKTKYHKGDATYETAGWYSSAENYFVTPNAVFFGRGGTMYGSKGEVGIFGYNRSGGYDQDRVSGRPVLVAQP